MKIIAKMLVLCTVYASIAAAQFSAAGDSVYTTPAKPTTKDSITYNFYDSDACCCAQFVNPSVFVSDTIVYLSFSVNTTPCQLCKCAGTGVWSAFKGGRLKAGRYSIYREQSFYCPPGTPCPLIALLPIRIGQVTVSPDTAYPQFRLTPPSPTVRDSVSLWFVKGTSSSCYPIGYFTSFTISDNQIRCITTPCPAQYTIKILYRELLVGIVCLPPLPPPTEYGPHFAFGKLAAGYYTIKDSTDSNKTLFEFSVIGNASVHSPVPLSRPQQGISRLVYSGGLLRFTLDRPQRLSISAYTASGREIPGVSRSGFYPGGMNGIQVKSVTLAGGMIFVRINGAGISEITRIKID